MGLLEGSATAIHRLGKQLRAWLAAGAIWSALGGGGPRAPPGIEDTLLLELLAASGQDVILSEALAVDTDEGGRRVVPGKCELAGELELYGLAHTADLEEAFAFIPELCTWIDVGVDQTRSSVRVERGMIEALLPEFRRLTVYHIHPKAEDGATYLPDYSDLLAVVIINGRHLRDRRIEILHRAVTPDGTFEYAFEPTESAIRAIDVIFSTGLGRYAGENLWLKYSASDHERSYHEALRACPALADHPTATLGSCFPMKSGDFLLLYRQPPELAIDGPS